MTDPTYHRDQAEKLAGPNGEWYYADAEDVPTILARAQVHATLATAPDYSVQMAELLHLREKVANLRAMLPTEPMPERGLPNELAYAQGWYGAWDMVRDELNRPEGGVAVPCGCDHHGDHAGCDADCECAR